MRELSLIRTLWGKLGQKLYFHHNCKIAVCLYLIILRCLMQFPYATIALKIERIQNVTSVWGGHPLTSSPQTYLVGTATQLVVI